MDRKEVLDLVDKLTVERMRSMSVNEIPSAYVGVRLILDNLGCFTTISATLLDMRLRQENRDLFAKLLEQFMTEYQPQDRRMRNVASILGNLAFKYPEIADDAQVEALAALLSE